MTSLDTAFNTSAWEELREDAIFARAEFLAGLTQLTRCQAEAVVRNGDVPLGRDSDLTFLVSTYGAAVNPDNGEHTGIRASRTLDALSAALPPHIAPVRGLSYQYCAQCNGRGGVQAFFTADPFERDIEAAVTRSNPDAPVITVLEASRDRVVMRADNGDTAEFTPANAALWMYSLHEGHACMQGRTASLEFATGATTRFVNMEPYRPHSPSLEMRVSSLLRCPNQPTRHLDMDMLLFDRRTASVVGVIEHAHMRHTPRPDESAEQDYQRCMAELASKPTTQTRAAAERFACAAYRIIDHERLGTVVHLLNGTSPRHLGGLGELVELQL